MVSGSQCKHLLFLITSASILLTTASAMFIPQKMDGFAYKYGPQLEKSLLVEAFLDPVCPDSRDAWSPLYKILNHYGDRLWLIVHPFPLPYHDNSFLISRVLHIVHSLKSSETFRVLDLLLTNQEIFYNRETRDLSRDEVVDRVVNLVGNEGYSSFMSGIRSGLNDSETDLLTRVSFKYGCLRGVFGTPTFFVNGFPLPDSGSALDYNGWRKIIDPLLNSLNK
ncbi:hypothetical protein ACHQM5_006518 [Ranunculus cassubicifolius]